jgi:hypothetical protein
MGRTARSNLVSEVAVPCCSSVFGAFCPVPWENTNRYFGNGDACLLALAPTRRRYKATLNNSHFVLSSPKGFQFGGGSDLGLRIDDEFLQGTSAFCETFGNEPLSLHRDFRCVFMEVWGFA